MDINKAKFTFEEFTDRVEHWMLQKKFRDPFRPTQEKADLMWKVVNRILEDGDDMSSYIATTIHLHAMRDKDPIDFLLILVGAMAALDLVENNGTSH